MDLCKQRIAYFMKTSTDQVQKFVLRDREWKGYEKKVN